MFKTLGDMFNPGNLPDIYPVKKLNTLPEPEYTWQCRRCDVECAGERGIGVCLSCETALRKSTDERDDVLKAELEKHDKWGVSQDINYDKRREIEQDMAEDRRIRNEDWQREYSHFSNFD